jgi:hypothetical protein
MYMKKHWLLHRFSGGMCIQKNQIPTRRTSRYAYKHMIRLCCGVTCTYAYIHTCSHAHMHTYTHVHAHMHTYTNIHTHMFAHVHTYTHAHMHTYTHTCSLHLSFPLSLRKRHSCEGCYTIVCDLCHHGVVSFFRALFHFCEKVKSLEPLRLCTYIFMSICVHSLLLMVAWHHLYAHARTGKHAMIHA